MVKYQQALKVVRDILNQYPEVKQLIKFQLNQTEDAQYVGYHEKPKNPEPQNHGTVPTDGTESSGAVPHEVGSGNVPDGNPSDVQSTETVEPQAVNKND